MIKITPLLLLILLGCSRQAVDPGKAARDRLVSAYTEMLKQSGENRSHSSVSIDSSVNSVKELLITHEDYTLAINYLNKDPERWSLFFKDTEDILLRSDISPDSIQTGGMAASDTLISRSAAVVRR